MEIIRVRGEVVDKPRRRLDGLEEGFDIYQAREIYYVYYKGN